MTENPSDINTINSDLIRKVELCIENKIRSSVGDAVTLPLESKIWGNGLMLPAVSSIHNFIHGIVYQTVDVKN
jgi:hypothetical protein